jgi:hypothetical protein
MLKRIIWKINFVVYKAVGAGGGGRWGRNNFDEFKSGGLHEKQSATACNFGGISEFT